MTLRQVTSLTLVGQNIPSWQRAASPLLLVRGWLSRQLVARLSAQTSRVLRTTAAAAACAGERGRRCGGGHPLPSELDECHGANALAHPLHPSPCNFSLQRSVGRCGFGEVLTLTPNRSRGPSIRFCVCLCLSVPVCVRVCASLCLSVSVWSQELCASFLVLNVQGRNESECAVNVHLEPTVILRVV